MLAEEENRLKEKSALPTTPKLLILDEIGYLGLDARRHLSAPVGERPPRARLEILTSNKSYGDWGTILRSSAAT